MLFNLILLTSFISTLLYDHNVLVNCYIFIFHLFVFSKIYFMCNIFDAKRKIAVKINYYFFHVETVFYVIFVYRYVRNTKCLRPRAIFWK